MGDFRDHEKETVETTFSQMISIAKSVKATLDTFAYKGFNSSETKVIDNAIIGYILKNGRNVKGKHKKSVGE